MMIDANSRCSVLAEPVAIPAVENAIESPAGFGCRRNDGGNNRGNNGFEVAGCGLATRFALASGAANSGRQLQTERMPD